MIELLLILCLGLSFGSFITCASYRLPLEIDVVSKPSFCPSCDHKLGFRDLFPVFSWLFQRGKCGHCKTPISPRYPLIEIITGLLFVFLYIRYGISWEMGILAAMLVMLMIMIVADIEHFIIPDCVHIVLLPLAIAHRYLQDAIAPDMLWGFGLMVGLALALHYGYSALRGRAMLGYGDVKFFAIVGVWLDLAAIPAFLLIAGILGVVFGIIWRWLGKGQVFPFGPALAVALFICVVFAKTVIY